MLGEDFAAEPLEYDLLLKELEAYRRHLFSIAERVLKCYPDHAGPQQRRGDWSGLHGRRDKPG
jgi:hypothetical protein